MLSAGRTGYKPDCVSAVGVDFQHGDWGVRRYSGRAWDMCAVAAIPNSGPGLAMLPPLGAYGILRLGWIGIVILVVAGGLRLYMWARERR
jgi:hypothetical protein